ncbi:sulfur reduction protein DsrE [Gelidibacter mesophilus]|uniref:sulfur reduction protein DsrE n=1 Tax=Gelidibacter mesophilus TaxID=169050 RepID=UPI0004832C0E|nr:sulfur reduction protein DsrE [Gelidibacter mesophilus]
MKTYIMSSLFLILTVFSTFKMKAQEMGKSKNNYVVLTTKVPQLQPIILTAQALKEEEGEAFGDFQVIICGKDIGQITDHEKINIFIEKAETSGVQIIACGFSLNKFKVNQSKIPASIKVVENGILYNFQLQKKGYKSLSL